MCAQITANGRSADAPLELGELRAVRSGDLVTVSLPDWLELKCNQRSDVCALKISSKSETSCGDRSQERGVEGERLGVGAAVGLDWNDSCSCGVLCSS